MNQSRKIACFFGGILAFCLTVPSAVQAEEVPAFTFSDRNVFQQDEQGNCWYQNGGETVTGKFSLAPDYALGDISQDTVIDAFDAARLLKASAESGAGTASVEELLLEQFPVYEDAENAVLYADINADAVINAEDAALILNYAAVSGSGENQHPLGYACYYADENGFLQKGRIQDAGTGEVYYADENYALISGWFSSDGNRYYLDKQTFSPLTGWQDIQGRSYYFSESGEMQTGWIHPDENFYYLDENGICLKGWQEIESQTYYLDEESGARYSGWMQKQENNYYLDENGLLTTGWKIIGNNSYYFSESGEMLTGWIHPDENFYYLDENGICLKDWQEIEGQTYYLDEETGARYSGWFYDEKNRYYLDENGLFATGWKIVGDNSYYFSESGQMQTGWLTLDENQYYLNPDGTMATGFVTVDGLRYYMGTNGILQKRKWLVVDGKTYYLGLKGDCLTGWQNLTGYIYYFQPDGAMSVGWTTVEDNTYYFDVNNGTMQTGWLVLDGLTYYLNSSGVRQTGWCTLSGYKYYFNINGIMTTGWATIGGNKYYFYPDNGTMAVNTTIDGVYLGSDGIASEGKLALNRQRAQDALGEYGSSVSAIYNYMRSTNRYKYIESTRTLEQIQANGWLYYVDYAFTHYYGVCYYMAAKMDFILQEAGYQCRIVHATHGSGDHYWNQVYLNGSWLNYDCTNGYNAYSWSSIIAAGNYTFLGYVTPVYQ